MHGRTERDVLKGQAGAQPVGPTVQAAHPPTPCPPRPVGRRRGALSQGSRSARTSGCLAESGRFWCPLGAHNHKVQGERENPESMSPARVHALSGTCGETTPK